MNFKSQLNELSNSKMLKRSVHTFVLPESAGISPFFRCQSAGALSLTRRRLGICRAFLAAHETLGPGSDNGERIRFDAVLMKVGVGGRGVGERFISTSGSGTLGSGTLKSGTWKSGMSGTLKSGSSETLKSAIVRV